MSLSFGTDGLRGAANIELTSELSLALGRAAALVVGGPFYVGRDTRESGQMLQSAFCAGVMAEGVDVFDLGEIPTPGVAILCSLDSVSGAVISASHNPWGDNGIKLLGKGGTKLSIDVEKKVEKVFHQLLSQGLVGRAEILGLVDDRDCRSGSVYNISEIASKRYITELHKIINSYTTDSNITKLVDINSNGVNFDLIPVTVDCANGAASAFAEKVFSFIDFIELLVINSDPDGRNINENCGSTHMNQLIETVKQRGGIGFALDGDADRMLAVDELGNVVDGDEIMAMLAVDLLNQKKLTDNTIVVTVMSNLGFKLAMKQNGITVYETPVGDRHVLEALAENSWCIGGEQSGHIILTEYAPTGDGMISALSVLSLMRRTRKRLSDLRNVMIRFPQVLKNVKVDDRDFVNNSGVIKLAIEAEQQKLLENGIEKGRILLRPSGTEPVVRVMVEAQTLEQAQEICDRLCSVIEIEQLKINDLK